MMQAADAAAGRMVGGALLLAGALLYLSFGYTEMAGSDLWWHIAAGRELLETRTLYMVDDWSYSAHGADWLNHEWLADIIYYGWVSLWGVQSLVYWKWLVIVATFVTLQLALSRGSGPLAAYVWAGLAVAIAAPFLDVRPHLYSLLLYCLLLYLLLQRPAPTWLLAGLFLVWVNLHGGFFFGLMALGILLFPWRELSLATFRPALVTGLICAVVVLLNPHGIGAYLYPLKYAFVESSPYRQLAEWLSPFEPGGIRSPLFFVFMYMPAMALVYLFPSVRRETGVPWEGLALTALTLAMALTSRRFIPLYAISLAVLIAPLTGMLLNRVRDRRVLGLVCISAFALALYRLAPLPLRAAPAYHYLTAEYSYPVDLVNFMRANDLKGRVFAYYNWGGYLHWRTDGDLKVYIDGRADTIYDADTYNRYVHILHSRENWVAALQDTGPDFILWPEIRALGQDKRAELLASGRWQLIYRDTAGWLLARRRLSLSADFKPSPDTPYRDLREALVALEEGDLPLATRYASQAWAAMPWHRDTCRMLAILFDRQGQKAEAQAVLEECLGHFPTPQLR